MLLLCSCTEADFIETNKSTEKILDTVQNNESIGSTSGTVGNNESIESTSGTVGNDELTESTIYTETNQTIEKSTKYDDVIDSNDLEYIYYLVLEETYSPVFNYNNQVKRSKLIEKPKELLQMSIVIDGVKHSLTYTGSIYQVLNNITRDCYYMDGNEDSIIRLENGQVSFLSYDQMKIDISPSATPEEVLPLLKTELSKLFDISRYEYVEMPKSKDKDKFGSYEFRFYNAIDGYLTEALAVDLRDTGIIRPISMSRNDFNISTLNISEDLEHQAIELKLKDTYGEFYHSYIIHEGSSKHLVLYKDELYIAYRIEPEIYRGDGTMCPGVQDIIIPLDMINNR